MAHSNVSVAFQSLRRLLVPPAYQSPQQPGIPPLALPEPSLTHPLPLLPGRRNSHYCFLIVIGHRHC
ncbi:uncharacterized protein BO80DRAFT_420763 [Aspergillus ibericus CBS 121593]|uniref:Uncharacterized protein n=1 Tax=Aspergillus ibericus CBS 121593 TaxID=1448316 RepID=A0A395HC70_9EURO|nr:hypothetical protein BO80DRAFT_420763 [Aspergillus ibericus CBS 121593]RAL05561.1 hypothetical protein BO80DRAFT_420763 [Aspergillus ibericus CBS 121593]